MIAISVLSAFTRSVNKGAPTSTNRIAKRFAIEHFPTRFLKHNFQNGEIWKDCENSKSSILSKDLQCSSDWWISWTRATSITDRSKATENLSTDRIVLVTEPVDTRRMSTIEIRSFHSVDQILHQHLIRLREGFDFALILNKWILLLTDWRMKRSPPVVGFSRARSWTDGFRSEREVHGWESFVRIDVSMIQSDICRIEVRSLVWNASLIDE